jgi:membrane-associated protease RseP (regulator of RpoE activity)
MTRRSTMPVLRSTSAGVVIGFLLQIFLLLVLGAFLVLGRWLAGLPFGEGRLSGAWQIHSENARLRVARAVGGIVAWYLGAGVVLALGLAMSGETFVDETSMRVNVAYDGPAARAGIMSGDRIVAVAGEPIATWDQLKRKIASFPDTPVPVEVERAGARLVFTPTPAGSPAKIMVGPISERRPVGAGTALVRALVEPMRINLSTARGLVRILAGREHAEVSGPVGIVKETGNAAGHGPGTALTLIGAIAAYVLPFVSLASLLVLLVGGRRRKTATTV